MKITVDFDEYEVSLLRKLRRELKIVAQQEGRPSPKMQHVVRGAVRMGIHSTYGEDFMVEDILATLKEGTKES